MLQKYDVFFERCALQPLAGKITWDEVVRNIPDVGTSSTILATDLGQIASPDLEKSLAILMTNSWTQGSVRKAFAPWPVPHALDCLGIHPERIESAPL